MNHRPEVSVIVASYNSQRTIERTLESLGQQTAVGRFEVIVIDSSTEDVSEIIKRRFPDIIIYRFSDRKFCGEARNFGISKARGKIIAFLDADCRADTDWIDSILKAHESPDLAIGGTIANGNPESCVGSAAYFCEFSRWMPGSRSDWLDDIAGASMSYKKGVFDRYGCFIEGTYSSDTEFHWRIGKDERCLRFDTSINVWHYNIDSFPCFLAHEYFHGRCFAKVRVRAENFSKLRRLVYSVLSPLIAVKKFYQILCLNLRNRRYLSRFIRVSPLVLLGVICWSLGESLGYMGRRTTW